MFDESAQPLSQRPSIRLLRPCQRLLLERLIPTLSRQLSSAHIPMLKNYSVRGEGHFGMGDGVGVSLENISVKIKLQISELPPAMAERVNYGPPLSFCPSLFEPACSIEQTQH